MELSSRTKPILSNENLKGIASLINSKAKGFNEKKVYITEIGQKNRDGEIIKAGAVYAYLWDKHINRGSISTNISVINGFQDPLFNDEGYIKIYYEIFPSASHNPIDSNLFNTFKEEQNTIKSTNYSITKSAINKIFSKIMRRR